MQFTPTELPDVIVIDPDVHRDSRGFFLETYQAANYQRAGITEAFVQDNHSRSSAGTVRGLHLQLRPPQGKLVRVIAGEIYDVAVDVRRGSPTFGCWVGVTLSAENFKQCYIPPGFAHGFCVTSAVAEVEYKCTALYDRSSEIGIAWNSPELAIPWPVRTPILSDRDARLPPLGETLDLLPVWREQQDSDGRAAGPGA
jgi:dTDP-4-dehydrorhamnose 3,5-epimerase